MAESTKNNQAKKIDTSAVEPTRREAQTKKAQSGACLSDTGAACYFDCCRRCDGGYLDWQKAACKAGG